MTRSLIVGCTMLTAAASLSAQQAGAPAAAAPKPSSPPAVSLASQAEQRVQVGNFEVFLQGALAGAVDRFGQWVQLQAAPSIIRVGAPRSIVQGFPTPEGLTFTVQQGQVIGQEIVRLTLSQQPQARASAASATVSAQGGIVTADPMTNPSAASGEPQPPAGPPLEGCARPNGVINGDQKLNECIEEGLINAMLDNSYMLPLKAGEWLTVVDVPVQAAFGDSSRKLILSIKAEDLKALHDQKISRDEAKARIVEKRF